MTKYSDGFKSYLTWDFMVSVDLKDTYFSLLIFQPQERHHKVQDYLESINSDISNHFFKCLTKYKIKSDLPFPLSRALKYFILRDWNIL